MIYVLYDNDPDGFGAAFAAWLKFGEQATYIPVKRGEPVPPIPDATKVYIVDFNYPRDTTIQLHDYLVNHGGQLIVIDHHASAQQLLSDLPYCIFNTGNSAAVLSWKYFHPEQSVPSFFGYIQDADLYTWALPFSREVHEALESWPMDFETWERLSGIDLPERDFVGEAHCIEDLIRDGEACLRYAMQQQKRIADNAQRVTIYWGGTSSEVPVVNSSEHASELCRMLLDRNPDAQFAACYCDLPDGVQQWSLRSLPGFDVSEVAKEFGGGGHRQASGFRMKSDSRKMTALHPEKDKAQ